jgi:site-specific DNA-methyltransferase (adenine-specific)
MITLHNQDCLEFMAGLPDNSIDMCLTDPPYYCTELPFDKTPRLDFKAWLKECQRVLKPHGVLVTFANFNLLADLRSKSPFKSTYELVWQKTRPLGFLDANRRPLRAHEFIGVFMDGLKKSTYNPQKTEGEPYKLMSSATNAPIYSAKGAVLTENTSGERHPHSVQKFSNGNYKSMHPTQKPLEACEWLIKTYSNEGETVFDGFAGSGSTAVACRNTSRNFIGCELDLAYFNLARKRLE